MKVNNYRIPAIIVFILQIACMLVFAPPSALGQVVNIPETQNAGAPILTSPVANATVDRATAQFNWLPPNGTAPTRYQVCVADEGQSCQQPGALIYQLAGQAPITGTSYTVSLPSRLQGKRFQWSVSACVPPRLQVPGGGEICTYANMRALSWKLPPPDLGAPPDDLKTSLRPTFSIRASVPGADRYLFCMAKPGVICPTSPGTKSGLVVAEARGTLRYQMPSDLTQFDGQTINWTAAACNDVVGCSYQPARRKLTLGASPPQEPNPPPPVICADGSNEIEIRNGQYRARISKATGAFTVNRLTGGGAEESAASGDSISFRLGTSQTSMTDGSLTNLQVRIEKSHSFYARIKVEGSVTTPPWGSLQVTKTYEFTRSHTTYEQLALRFTGQQIHLPIRELIWRLSVTDPERVSVVATTDDFIVRYPTLGSSHPLLPGTPLPCLPQPECKEQNRSINLQHSGNADPGIDLLREEVLLANRAISVNADIVPSYYTCNSKDVYRCSVFSTNHFYPGLGIRSYEEKKRLFKFNNWDRLKYAMENVAPVPPAETNRQTEDWLIRLTMFAMDQLATDHGWWAAPAWTGGGGVEFPAGDRYTDDARSYPALAYVWAHLTMRNGPQGWTHAAGDADAIYHQLQQTYSWYIESDPAVTEITSNPAMNFADRSPSGAPYLSYSQHLKERYGPDSDRTVKGVINTHSTALHWAWLMAEASRLFGDSKREREWRDVITRYHEGSREMLRLAYPAHRNEDPATIYTGLIPYQRDQRDLTDAQKMDYVDITFKSIAAGYLNSDTYEAEFADVVERASRLDTDPFPCNRNDPQDKWDPDLCNIDGADIVVSWANSPYIARLARLFPAALAFARQEEMVCLSDGCDTGCIPPPTDKTSWGPDMSRDLSTASLTEVLSYDAARGMRIHDPAKFISEGNGRKWILTNTRFLSHWSPGFWEEVDPVQAPANALFEIQITSPPTAAMCDGRHGEHYSAYRMGNKIFIITDYSGGTLTLALPGSQLQRGISQLSFKRRAYNQGAGRWDAEQPATGVAVTSGSNGRVLIHLQQVQRKALTVVEIQP
ncbi:MAG TPA: hypothetical protein VJ810_06585 [Blastocatellia bacterium]|nr:hypothetical protein [Blastocatellia bacterium]